MSQIVLKNKCQKRFQTLFAFATVLAFVGALILGMFINTPKNCIIIPVSPFKDGDIFGALSEICLFDLLMLWIITVPLCNSLRIAVSSLVYFGRGLVVGCALKVFTENSLSAVAMVVVMSYAAVTLVAMIYDAVLNGTGEKSNFCRMISCLIVTGGCAFVRIIPMILIK